MMVQQIQSGEPVAVVANTRRTNNTVSYCAHWILVDSFSLSSSSYSDDWDDLNGFYMNDPLYNSGFTGYESVSPNEYVSKANFFNPTSGYPIASKCSTYLGQRYALVRD